MRTFPRDFAELLTPRGRRIVERGRRRDGKRFRFAAFKNVIDGARAKRAFALLDRHLYGDLRAMRCRIPRSTITEMEHNYSEQLPKTMRQRTALIDGPRSSGYASAARVGLTRMMRSEGLRAFAEAVSGVELVPGPGCQVVCYAHGDYAGPHNDHHPEDEHLADGYVDIHLGFSNDAVKSQLLVYEEDGFLSQCVEVGVPAAVLVYRLPFWHYASPLVAKAKRERDARRWLVAASFEIARG